MCYVETKGGELLIENSMGNLTLIGARPGVGKTKYAVDIAAERTNTGQKVIYFCPLKRCDLFREEIEEQTQINPIALNNLILNDTAGLSISDILGICSNSIGATVILDELTEFCDSKYKPGVEKVFKTLKSFAKEKGIDVIVLSDLLSSADNRKNYIPELEDVKYSEIITKYIDNAVLLTKPELYDEFASEKGIVERKISLS